MIQIYLLLLDLSIPLLMAYLVLKKGSISVVYVPFFFFMFSMQEKSRIIAVYHLLLAVLLIYYVIFNLPFLKKNILFVILILYYTFQLKIIDDYKSFRIYIIGLYWTFTIIALAPEICRNYSKSKIFKELGDASFLLLSFFIFNTILSTGLGYYPRSTYGFTSGISFGNISISEYNIFPFVVFLIFRRGMLDKKPLYLLVGVVSLFLIMLTLRRMVMALSLLAILIVMLEFLNFKQIKQFALYGLVFGIVVLVVLQTTGFSEQLVERIEKRNLEGQELTEELRYLELGLLYKDMFVYYDYSPWFGYGPLSSWGNYGKKAFGNRPLHTDIGYFIHGFGLFGFFLYVTMVTLVFYQAWIRCESRGDRLLFLFTALSFGAFFLVGSPKMPLSPIMLFMTLGILFGKKEKRILQPKKNELVCVQNA